MRSQSTSPHQNERQLLAILAADIVGYSRLMENDEEGTLAQLRACRSALIEPCIAAHKGDLAKTTGDGLLVRFASPVEAVRCAIEMQESMTRRNLDLPEHKLLKFRIGINLGDVIVEDGDIASMSRHAYKCLQSRVESAFPARFATKSAIECRWRWRIWESSRSRTSLDRYGCSAFATPAELGWNQCGQRNRLLPCPTSRRSPCCLLQI
jgi:hypothetical protein